MRQTVNILPFVQAQAERNKEALGRLHATEERLLESQAELAAANSKVTV